jgi:hypothetical protein
MHIYVYNDVSLINPPLLSLLAYSIPFCIINRPLYLIGDPLSYGHGVNIHPLLSLVSYQLSSPCCSTHPEDTLQIKLHIYIDDITTSAAPSDTLNLVFINSVIINFNMYFINFVTCKICYCKLCYI